MLSILGHGCTYSVMVKHGGGCLCGVRSLFCEEDHSMLFPPVCSFTSLRLKRLLQSSGDLQNDEETAATILHMVHSSGKLMSALSSERRGNFHRLSSELDISRHYNIPVYSESYVSSSCP